MADSKRAKQNRINAQKSTGPRIPHGKSISRCNSIKHGLTAEIVTLPDESPEILQAHLSRMDRSRSTDRHRRNRARRTRRHRIPSTLSSRQGRGSDPRAASRRRHRPFRQKRASQPARSPRAILLWQNAAPNHLSSDRRSTENSELVGRRGSVQNCKGGAIKFTLPRSIATN